MNYIKDFFKKIIINYSRIIYPLFSLQSRDPNSTTEKNVGFSKKGPYSSLNRYIDTEFLLRILPALTSQKLRRINSYDDKPATEYKNKCKENSLEIKELDPTEDKFPFKSFPYYDCLKSVKNTQSTDAYKINSYLLLNILWFINYSNSETLKIKKKETDDFEFKLEGDKKIVYNENYMSDLYSSEEQNISKTEMTQKGTEKNIYKFIGVYKNYTIRNVNITDKDNKNYNYTFACFQIYNDRWYISLDHTEANLSYISGTNVNGVLDLLGCTIIFDLENKKKRTNEPTNISSSSTEIPIIPEPSIERTKKRTINETTNSSSSKKQKLHEPTISSIERILSDDALERANILYTLKNAEIPRIPNPIERILSDDTLERAKILHTLKNNRSPTRSVNKRKKIEKYTREKYTKEEIQKLMEQEKETFKNFQLATSNYIKETIGIEIIGLYTKKEIKNEKVIGEYFGIMYDTNDNIYDIYNRYKTEFDVDPKNFILRNTKTYDFHWENDIAIDASIDSHSSFTKFINSSYPNKCMTNCIFENDDNRVVIKAIRDIEKDEELFLDYGFNTPIIIGDTNYFKDITKQNYNDIVSIVDLKNIKNIKENKVNFEFKVYKKDDKLYDLKCQTDINNFLKKYTFGMDNNLFTIELQEIYDNLCSKEKEIYDKYKFKMGQQTFSRNVKFEQELENKLETVRKTNELNSLELMLYNNIINKDGRKSIRRKSKRKSKRKSIRRKSIRRKSKRRKSIRRKSIRKTY